MSILVTCPGCHTRFQVGDQFAGKSGPCPKCKVTIRVPTKKEEVKIVEPEQFASGGRGATGRLSIKPIARKELKIHPVIAAAVAGSVLLVLLVAWVARGPISKSVLLQAVGLLLVSPPLAIAGYSILRDDELEPHRGLALYLRGVICALAYAALWASYGFLAKPAMSGELWNWVIVGPPFLIAGGLVALVSFNLEFGDGMFHYSFYLLATVLLRKVAGMGWL